MNRLTIIFVLMAAAFLYWTNIGYIQHAAGTPEGAIYTGANVYSSTDKLVYMSMIEQGREGLLWMKNLHTTASQQGLMLSPHWYVIGQTAKLFSISNHASYQIYRIIFTILFLWLLYYWLRRLYPDSKGFKWGAGLVLFSGGLGWIVELLRPEIFDFKQTLLYLNMPADAYVTEGNTFLNFMQSPLFILSQLLILLIFYFYIKYRDSKDYYWYGILGLVAAFLTIIHPYDLPIIAGVIGTWSLWYAWSTKKWHILLKLLILYIGLAAGAVYNFSVVLREPVLATWLEQNLVFSPPISRYLWAYGPLLLFWLVGILVIAKKYKQNVWWMLMTIWSSLIMILLYSPLDVNRRFINGWHIAIALIAALGVVATYKHINKLSIKVIFSVAIAFLFFSGTIFNSAINSAVNLFQANSVYNYVSEYEQNALEYIRLNSQKIAGILPADEFSPLIITSQLNRPVLYGHPHQTPESHLRRQEADWFFGVTQSEEALARKRQFLIDNKIEFIYINIDRVATVIDITSLQRLLGNPVYRNDEIIIFRLTT